MSKTINLDDVGKCKHYEFEFEGCLNTDCEMELSDCLIDLSDRLGNAEVKLKQKDTRIKELEADYENLNRIAQKRITNLESEVETYKQIILEQAECIDNNTAHREYCSISINSRHGCDCPSSELIDCQAKHKEVIEKLKQERG